MLPAVEGIDFSSHHQILWVKVARCLMFVTKVIQYRHTKITKMIKILFKYNAISRLAPTGMGLQLAMSTLLFFYTDIACSCCIPLIKFEAAIIDCWQLLERVNFGKVFTQLFLWPNIREKYDILFHKVDRLYNAATVLVQGYKQAREVRFSSHL